ncbi:Integral membrane protein (plasmid) [Streptantibioticus cattleyicolor NRRL 8057 = DSM 46488]|nr:Integral membrane protein [Streptantibioticus cattleyicolor NRRL 8057 = DSM 46488]
MTTTGVRRTAALWRAASRLAARPAFEVVVLAGCAVAALAVGVASPAGTAQETWGLAAAGGYGAACLVAAGSRVRWGSGAAAVAVAGAVVVPLVRLVVAGKAQMEVGVIERGAATLLSSGTPYLQQPRCVPEFNPYLPGMSVFGLPHALFGDHLLTSARLWMTVAFLAAMAAAVRMSGAGGRGLLWLTACPVLALPLVIGGVDPPVVGLLCLALSGARAGRPVAAGLAVGAAAALKWTAWPALAVLPVLVAVCRGRRAAGRCAVAMAGVALVCTLPAAVVDADAFVTNVVLYPSGLARTVSTAASPLPGRLIADLLPDGKAVTMVLLGLAAAAVGVSLLVRPPRGVVAAGDRLALGLTIAVLLMPATRVGSAVYPVALMVWPRLIAAVHRRTATVTVTRRTAPVPVGRAVPARREEARV